MYTAVETGRIRLIWIRRPWIRRLIRIFSPPPPICRLIWIRLIWIRRLIWMRRLWIRRLIRISRLQIRASPGPCLADVGRDWPSLESLSPGLAESEGRWRDRWAEWRQRGSRSGVAAEG